MKDTDRLKFSIGALDLRRACGPKKSAESMLDCILKILREFVSFDIATYAEYVIDPGVPVDQDPVLVLGRYAVDNEQRFHWPDRWIRIPTPMYEWVNKGQLAISDIENFFKIDPEFERLREHPVVKEYMDRGARSFVVIPFKEEDKTVSALTLARKEGSPPFSDEEEVALRELHIVEVLELVRFAYQAEKSAFYQEIRDLFSQKTGPMEAAEVAVRRLCEHYRWDYVAIYRPDETGGVFHLLKQHNASKKNLEPRDSNYAQPLDAGVLGNVLKTHKPIRVQDTKKGRRHGYLQISDDARSCLCYPIMLDEGVEWILDCESSEARAFEYPDEQELSSLVTEVQKSMALWFETGLSRELIENVGQGVIVVDQANRIVRLNTVAAELLGARSVETAVPDKEAEDLEFASNWSVRYKELGKFASDRKAKSVLARNEVSETSILLRGEDGRVSRVAVSSVQTRGMFGRRIWRLTDTTSWNWVTGLEYMRATVQSVAQQTRGSLLLADLLLAKAGKLSEGNDNVQGLLSKVRSNLSKAEITYERLAANRQSKRASVPNPSGVDLRILIERFKDELPAGEREALSEAYGSHGCLVWADAGHVRFAIHSTIGFLLAIRRPSAQIFIRTESGDTHVTLHMEAEVRSAADLADYSGEKDKLALAKAEALEASTHAMSTVKTDIENNHGKLHIIQKASKLGIEIILPVLVNANKSTQGTALNHAP